MSPLTLERYRLLVHSKPRSKVAKKRASQPRLCFLGRRIMALSAGLKESALKAEISTEAAIVSANCL